MGGFLEFENTQFNMTAGRKVSATEGLGAAFDSRQQVGVGFFADQDLDRAALADQHAALDEIYRGRAGEFSAEVRAHMTENANQPDLDHLRSIAAEMDALGIERPDALTDEAIDRSWNSEVLRRQQAIAANEDTLSRTAAPTAIGFAGAIGAEFTDPINLATVFVGAPAKAGLLSTVALEAGLNAAIEAGQTPNRNTVNQALGLEEESVIGNALLGAGFGAALGGTVKGAQMAFPAAKEGAIAGAQRVGATTAAARRTIAQTLARSNNPAERGIAQQVLLDVEEADLAVSNSSPEATREHDTRTQEAHRALETGEAPQIPARPVTAVPRGSILNGEIEEVSPRDLVVQPKVFQFKSEADGGGVTDKLRDVPEWRSERAGVVLAFEYADGTRAVADGHQRTALAKRIMDADPTQDIKVATRVFREADGFTVEQVRQLAALKNIAEAADGMTTALARDAAKVLRVEPEAISQLPQGPGIARAQNLSALSDDAFALVINDVLPDRYAEIIGRDVADPSLHLAMVRLLERTQPSTTAQAEAIIQQALSAPITREVTEDLFGAQEIAESLFIERAKVLERAMRTLRDDRKTFAILTERGDKIEGSGKNKLDKANNKETRERLEKALAAVDALAYRAGPISEALNDGAKAYKESGRLKDASDAVVAIITDELRRNGFDGAGAGAGRQPSQSAETVRNAPDPHQGFDNPITGQGVADQVNQTRLDANERPQEGFNSDAEARADLGRLVASGASREEIDAHPAVVSALQELEARAANATNLSEVYGGDEWHASREYIFDGAAVNGTEAALPLWVENAESFAGGAVKRERRATIVLGPPAAGKSTIAEELARTKGAAILDSDEIKQTLPEFEGGIGAAAVHEESSDLTDLLEAALRADGTNIVFPKVSGSPGSIRKAIDRFKADGYTVEIVNMAVTKENAYKRMIGRFVSKGRLIPPEYVDAVGDSPSQTYRAIKDEGKADGYAEIDNNGGLDEPQPITDRAGENPLAGSRFDLQEGGRARDVPREPDAATPRETEATPEGEQFLIDGLAPITARERIQSAADAPMQARPRGGDSEIGGLFDPNDPGRFDLFDQVPTGRVVNDDGVEIASTVSRAELAAELDADDEFVEALGVCLK